jgi:hypothetical protein
MFFNDKVHDWCPTLTMGAVSTYEKSFNFYEITRQNVSEYNHFQRNISYLKGNLTKKWRLLILILLHVIKSHFAQTFAVSCNPHCVRENALRSR